MILKRFNLKSIQGIGNVISELALLKFPVWIYIGDERANRSNSQNKYLWGVVYKLIGEYEGNFPYDVHENCKEYFGIKKFIKSKLGEKEITISTTEYDTKEFSEYIERIRIFYAPYVHIPDANSIPDELMIEMNKR